MIRIEDLTKIYKAKNKSRCVALDHVTLTLPDTGFVFIVGKSGSGKSTLLNLLGGLDGFDGGDIVCFGHSLKGFRERDYEAYRSDYVSFIFQDYHLIDELTILENITLFSSDLTDETLLRDTLETVGMTEYIHRYPNELSGGQKQRVAIARGIMKSPRIILCDEPTGNLDRKTSQQILELLRRISREKLVIIVSHNLTEAETYADRIIELADGRIVDDIRKVDGYCDDLLIDGATARLPYRKKMSEDELSRLNQAVREGSVESIELNSSGFVPTELAYEPKKLPLVMRKLGKKNLGHLFKKFFFSKKAQSLGTAILCTFLFGVFAVIQSFLSFNAQGALAQSMDDRHPMMVIEREYDLFYKNIYDDLSFLENEETYPLYSQTIWLNAPGGSSWDNGKAFSDAKNLEELYIHENYGLLVCDEAFLLDLYGRDGELSLLCGALPEEGSDGVLITDYFADSILYHDVMMQTFRYTSYESILGAFCPASVNYAANIVGILDTGYKDRHGEIFDAYDEYRNGEVEYTEQQIEQMILAEPKYMEFLDEVKCYLGIGYTFNENYIDAFDLSHNTCVRTGGICFEAEGKSVSTTRITYFSTIISPEKTSDYADDEIAVPYYVYNGLFGTSYTEQDAGKLEEAQRRTLTLKKYEDDDSKKRVLYEKVFTVTSLTTTRPVMNEENMLAFRKADWHPSRIYIKAPKSIGAISDFVTENEYHYIAEAQQSFQQIHKVIITFSDLFRLLEFTILAIIALYIIFYGMRSIKQNSYQIGVIKALGGRNFDVERIFVSKTFFIGVLTAVVAALIAVPFLSFANSVLLESVEEVIGVHLHAFDIIRVVPSYLVLDALVMIGIAFISALIPSLMLKRIRPFEIIKAKE